MEYNIPSPTSKGSSSSSNANKSNEKEKKGVKKNKRVKLSTDPQSVAARERRHRISDRFKILQSMVPGGSKMDTVSMLEEAIHYVKFLKTQIFLHQTMINFVDNIDNSLLIMLPPQEYFPYEENIISLQQQNSTVSVDSLHTSVPQLPPEEQCCFQGEDDTIATFDDHVKYWPA